MPDDPSFGQRMAAKRRAGELPPPPGRPSIAAKYTLQVAAAEKVFAKALPVEAVRYVAELQPKDPEQCPTHHRVLRCPNPECSVESERMPYDHKAAAYLFDRIMGKPTSRSEQTITVRFVEELAALVIVAFEEVNYLGDPESRRTAFASRCEALISGAAL